MAPSVSTSASAATRPSSRSAASKSCARTSRRAPPDARELHRLRDVAESFGADADRYDRARPTYPPDLVHRVVAGRPGLDVEVARFESWDPAGLTFDAVVSGQSWHWVDAAAATAKAADGMRATGAFGEPERLAELLAAVGAAIDAAGGAFTMAYATVAVTATRR
jgi:hypothetical protein